VSIPVLQSLLLADHVYKDGSSGKYIICGIFNVMGFKAKPDNAAQENTKPIAGQDNEADELKTVDVSSVMQAGSPFAYISLTEVRGELNLELRYVALVDNSVLLSTKFRIKCDNPLQTVELSVPLPPLPNPTQEEGVYALELLCEDHPLGSHRVQRKHLTAPKGE